MEIKELYEKITGEAKPRFLTERKIIIFSKCLKIINTLISRTIEMEIQKQMKEHE